MTAAAPAAPAATSRREAIRAAVVVLSTIVVFNGAFFLLSSLYFEDKPAWSYTPDDLMRVRGAFAVMTLAIGTASLVAALSPRKIGHALAALLGGVELVFGVVALVEHKPPVLGVTLLVAGALTLELTRNSWRGSRAAWAFLVAMIAVVGTCLLFGAPKVRSQLGIGLWTALILPGLQYVTCISLALLRRDYQH